LRSASRKFLDWRRSGTPYAIVLRHVDPDLAGELLRKNLNVAHPDEVIMLVH
jgi:hypothetical protein